MYACYFWKGPTFFERMCFKCKEEVSRDLIGYRGSVWAKVVEANNLKLYKRRMNCTRCWLSIDVYDSMLSKDFKIQFSLLQLPKKTKYVKIKK